MPFNSTAPLILCVSHKVPSVHANGEWPICTAGRAPKCRRRATTAIRRVPPKGSQNPWNKRNITGGHKTMEYGQDSKTGATSAHLKSVQNASKAMVRSSHDVLTSAGFGRASAVNWDRVGWVMDKETPKAKERHRMWTTGRGPCGVWAAMSGLWPRNTVKVLQCVETHPQPPQRDQKWGGGLMTAMQTTCIPWRPAVCSGSGHEARTPPVWKRPTQNSGPNEFID